MSNKVTKCNVYHDAQNNHWYFAIWCGDEYDTNGECDLPDTATAQDAIAWAESQWPDAVVREVDPV